MPVLFSLSGLGRHGRYFAACCIAILSSVSCCSWAFSLTPKARISKNGLTTMMFSTTKSMDKLHDIDDLGRPNTSGKSFAVSSMMAISVAMLCCSATKWKRSSKRSVCISSAVNATALQKCSAGSRNHQLAPARRHRSVVMHGFPFPGPEIFSTDVVAGSADALAVLGDVSTHIGTLWNAHSWHTPDMDFGHIASNIQDWVDAHRHTFDLVPPAHAEEIVLDPNTKYLYGHDGKVLIDPLTNKPLADDWWNSFVGFQADVIRSMDAKLRELGVEQAFGWTIVLYTLMIKVIFAPLQESQLRSSSMMQLLQPKMKELQEKFKDNPQEQQARIIELYSKMDVNPLGGCLPTLLTIPIYLSLYGVWRRLPAEGFPHYNEKWLWVPSLAQPNPDFHLKMDWLFNFQGTFPDIAPVMGWEDYCSYLIFPALLVGFTFLTQQQAMSSRTAKTDDPDDPAAMMTFLPWISVYFIGSLSLQLPQAVSVYYTANTALTLAQTAWVKHNLRSEIPGYEEFEKTGKFPDGSLEAVSAGKIGASTVKSTAKTLYEACRLGDLESIEQFLSQDPSLLNTPDDKRISPAGYAVAMGHLSVLRLLARKGANLQYRDGSNNTLLHYAAGYGRLDILKELLALGRAHWADNSWIDIKNVKDQSVIDAARVNKKTRVVEFLKDRVGIVDAEVITNKDTSVVVEASSSFSQKASSDVASPTQDPTAKARAALLGMMSKGEGSSSPAVEGVPVLPGGNSVFDPKNSETVKKAIAQLRSNPKAVEEAKNLMSKLPPQLLSMLSGNKLTTEQAQRAVKNMENLTAEDMLSKAELVAQKLDESNLQPAPVSGPPVSNSSVAKCVD